DIASREGNITSRWQYGMDFDQERPGDVKVEGPKWIVVMNRTSAKKADGMTIDYVKGPGGEGFKIENPNEPPRVKLLEPKQLAAWMEEGKPMEVIDVRTPEERATAKIEGTRLLDDEARHMLEELEKTHTLVFYCHSGMRSQRAAEQAIAMGFTDVFNLAGGIDAWSREVDSSVPRY
ncbi:MAG TPA: rhodanese-like domain-containing protein, partial [Polyangiaceae bacterium LLY-WYZ-15_(1-7)]|nr:rhodanese-like domain-containing protein [Polyangiaceae bacterium LLY-WYZ-15_(1-7)]